MNIPKKIRTGWGLFFLICWPLLLRAEIILTSPANDATISAMAPELHRFLDLPQSERRAYFNDKEKRKLLQQVRDAQPFLFQWKCTERENGRFTVVISEKEDFSQPSPALALSEPSSQTAASAADANLHEARVVNLPIGRKYYWKVVCEPSEAKPIVSKAGTFKTDADAPCLLTIPNVGNVRDLGGRKGLEGKMIRQGLVYRSSGLNFNSPDFNKEKMKAENLKYEDFSAGATKLTPASEAYINTVLGWKTDLDLRAPGEVTSMKGSPAGSCVRWVNHSSSAYAGIFGKNGDCLGSGPATMAENFRVFCDRKNYPIVFHCIGGADRTGALAYVLNGVLGVDKDALEKDWEVTANDYFKYEGMFDDLANGFNSFGAPEAPLHQKIEAYLHKIGITAEEITAFRSIMLEK